MVQPDDPALRVTVGLVDRDLEAVAKVLADAAGNVPARAGQR